MDEVIDHHIAVPLDGTGIDRNEAGEKAWVLDRLVEHGFPVPPAAAVLADAYRRFTSTEPIERLIADLRVLDPDETTIDPGIERIFLATPLPADVETAIVEIVTGLLASGEPLVIRSSPSEAASHRPEISQCRGQSGVTSISGALDAIRRCWASMWFPAARTSRGDDNVPGVGVIVQREIPARWSGVMATMEAHGDGATMRIESFPTPNRHPTGKAVPGSDHHLDRRTLAVLSRREAPPPFLEDLGRLGLRIERRFGEPQVIEWLIDGAAIWVTQSRPVTVEAAGDPADDGFDTDGAPNDLFTAQGVSEMLPGILGPLTWSINRPIVEEGFRSLLERSGAHLPRLDRPLIARFHGRAALNLDALKDAVSSLPGGIDISGAYLGTAETPPNGKAPKVSLLGVTRAWRVQRRIEDEVGVLSTAVACLPLIEPNLSRLTTVRLIEYRRELRNLAARGVSAELTASNAAATSYENLTTSLSRWLGPPQGALEAQRITSGHLASTSIGPRRIAALAAVIDHHATPAMCSIISEGPQRDTVQRLMAAEPGGTALAAALIDRAREFGSVSVYAGPTFEELESELWRLAAAAAGHDTASVTPSVESAVDRAIGPHASGRRWRLLRLVTGQIIDVRRRLIHRLAADAIRFLAMREEAKHALLVLGGLERRANLEGAARLQRSGTLRSATEVEYVSDAEFEQMLSGGEPVGWAELERRAAALDVARRLGPLPSQFRGSRDVESEAPAFGDRITGWAASPGTVRGRVRHVHSVLDGDTLQPGEVLVAVTTDPSWTPLFLVAGAIVLEQGGPLSHAAIVARELGMPAVLNVAGAMRRLPVGSVVEVDGTEGIVRPVAAEVSKAVSR